MHMHMRARARARAHTHTHTQVEYINSKAVFIDNHTVELTNKRGEKSTKTADKFIIATGGRPKYLDIANDREVCL